MYRQVCGRLDAESNEAILSQLLLINTEQGQIPQ